jgi:hypothetical protein
LQEEKLQNLEKLSNELGKHVSTSKENE